MNKEKIAWVLIFAFIIIFIINTLELDFSNLTFRSLLNPLANILMIIAMWITIKQERKEK
ncbi:hypothetical protein GGR42_002308 [Saonia flava]|uniref:Uncharacterized protein n=1 Tax=Saonia flava TaxID=523696 RepID=A0A846QS82_9FLAO|nr:hypothetical protein [Saonia flava]NJB71846.1 hypothetical protein [Saonia flava]